MALFDFLVKKLRSWIQVYLKKEVPSSFCVMPWVHSYISSDGLRKMCCLDVGESKESLHHTENFEYYWNSSEIRSVRKAMIEGRSISRCKYCFEKNNQTHSLRVMMNKTYGYLFPQLIDLTKENGETSFKPIYFDHRTHLCNFKCRTCGPYSSSAAESEALKNPELGAIDVVLSKKFSDQRDGQRKAIGDAGSRELLNAIEERRVERIYWAGGEPLISREHWDTMNELVKSRQTESVEVIYNTNLSKMIWKGQDFIELVNQFKKVSLLVSFDGANEVGEYVRSGFKFDNFDRNIKDLHERFKKGILRYFGFDITLTNLGLIWLPEMIEYMNRFPRAHVKIKLLILCPSNEYLGVENLPRQIKNELCDRVLEKIRQCPDPRRYREIEDLIPEIKMRKSFAESLDADEYARKVVSMKKFIRAFEKIRSSKVSFEDLLRSSELRSWWEQTGKALSFPERCEKTFLQNAGD